MNSTGLVVSTMTHCHVVDFSEEASQVVKEIRPLVKHADCSIELLSTSSVAYINVITGEGDVYCVRLNSEGYKVVSDKKDNSNVAMTEKTKTFETMDQLLNEVSACYRQAFAGALVSRLASLQEGTNDADDNDGVE